MALFSILPRLNESHEITIARAVTVSECGVSVATLTLVYVRVKKVRPRTRTDSIVEVVKKVAGQRRGPLKGHNCEIYKKYRPAKVRIERTNEGPNERRHARAQGTNQNLLSTTPPLNDKCRDHADSRRAGADRMGAPQSHRGHSNSRSIHPSISRGKKARLALSNERTNSHITESAGLCVVLLRSTFYWLSSLCIQKNEHWVSVTEDLT